MNNIRYIVTIEHSTGKIVGAVFPNISPEPEGVDEAQNRRILYVTDSNLPLDCEDMGYFVEEHYFNPTTLQFVHIGKPVNDYATWNFSTSSWDWDASSVLEDIRKVRQNMLFRSDWTQLTDNSLTTEQRAEAATYRTALRNITNNLGNPATIEDVAWPTPPSFLR